MHDPAKSPACLEEYRRSWRRRNSFQPHWQARDSVLSISLKRKATLQRLHPTRQLPADCHEFSC